MRGGYEKAMLARWLAFVFYGPALLTFLVMGAALGGSALCTYNLYRLFSANFELIATYGVMALFDGGLRQLLGLAFWGYFGVFCYFVFKGCEHGLMLRVPQRNRDAPPH